jgi:hypothetical protein
MTHDTAMTGSRLDRHQGSPITRSEQVSDWVFEQSTHQS